MQIVHKAAFQLRTFSKCRNTVRSVGGAWLNERAAFVASLLCDGVCGITLVA